MMLLAPKKGCLLKGLREHIMRYYGKTVTNGIGHVNMLSSLVGLAINVASF